MDKQKIYKEYLQHKTNYYKGNPTISDAEFDKLEEKIVEFGFPKTIGYKNENERDKYPHPTKMLSLGKYQLKEGEPNTNKTVFEKCYNNFKNKNKFFRGLLSYKYDGIAINLIYVEGKLQRVLTRGDGNKGVDVTKKLKFMFPNFVNYTKPLEVRCEVYMGYDKFSNYKEKYKHPRNLVGGIINNISLEDKRVRDLTYAVIELIDSRNNEILNYEKLSEISQEMTGFQKIYGDIDSLNDFIDKSKMLIENRKYVNFPTDGMVFSMEKEGKMFLQHNGNSPEHATAIKFEPPKMVSEITGFEWVLHKSGRFAPKIFFKPIEVDGRTISQMSGYNIEYLVLKNIFVGSKIEIVLSNDIIPMIGEVLEENPKEYINENDFGKVEILNQKYDKSYLIDRFEIPKNTKVIGCDLYIDNMDENDSIKRLKFYNILEQFEVYGVSRKTHEKLSEIKELYEDPTFIFSDEFNTELLKSYGFGEKVSENIVNGYKKHKEDGIPITKIIKSLSIDGCGNAIAKEYGKKLSGVDYDFTGLNSKIIKKLDGTNEINNFIEKLKSKNVEVIYFDKKENKSMSLVILTGSPKKFGFKSKKEFLGENPDLQPTKKFSEADFIVTDNMESKSNKMKKAREKGITILSYGDFS